MRIAIREQLGLLVLFACLVSVAVLSVAVWVTNTNFVTSVNLSSLSLAATLYAEQLATNLLLIQNSVVSISTRVLIQTALGRYNFQGNATAANWIRAYQDLQIGLGTGGSGQYLLQTIVVGKNATGINGTNPLVNVTSNSTVPVALPTKYGNGSSVILGDWPQGYPSALYPNLTFGVSVVNSTFNTSQAFFLGQSVNESAPLLLGPWQINETFALSSLTIPIINNTSIVDVLGWMTVVFSSDLIYQISNSILGLGATGQNLIVAPSTPNNRLPRNLDASKDLVRFVVPPTINSSRTTRHARAAGSNYTFSYSQFAVVQSVFMTNQNAESNAGSNLDTYNEEGDHVSAGFALVGAPVADWAVIVEEDYNEVHQPIDNLRNVLLACIFGTIGVIILSVFPLAHYSVRPIRSLRAATLKTVDPYDFSDRDEESERGSERGSSPNSSRNGVDEENQEVARKEGFITRVTRFPFRSRTKGKKTLTPPGERKFRIPGKVNDGKHFITDELTDLTTTFNDMCEELMMQYGRLEERVKERTAELELSKKAAEAANESKTLFIANISHELKTPLNGILGMCAVSMHEEDTSKIKRSLGIIYKSGDLLLNLLTDLLTFSKNQIGQHLTLDEKEFRLADISSQVLSIFDKQSKEGGITLGVIFEGPSSSLETASGTPGDPGYGPFGTGRVKDMCLWGDQHRILQVVINLVSNSLKFTPPGGTITVRIRCIGETEMEDRNSTHRKDSTNSKGSRQTLNSRASKGSKGSKGSRDRASRFLGRGFSSGSGSDASFASSTPPHKEEKKNIHTAIEINSREPKALSPAASRDRSRSPPPLNTKYLIFDFEVEDTGPGIPPAQQRKIFEPFVQGDLGLSKKYGGTGLGLSICAQLATLMRGTMSLRSIEGEGSIFAMQIPLRFIKERASSARSSSYPGSLRNSVHSGLIKDEPMTPRSRRSDDELSSHSARASSPPARAVLENPPSKPRLVGLSTPFFAASPPLETEKAQLEAMQRVKEQAASSNAKVRVLVAEDNKVNQEVVLRMLKLEDIYDVTVAKDGQEAYDLVKESMEQKRFFNLIFMDVQMPNLDGLQSTRLIRGMGYSAPIVALTAFAEESNVRECMDSGMDFFLPKPIRRPALKQVLKKYCATIPEEPESPPGLPRDEPRLDVAEGASTADPTPTGSESTAREPETETQPTTAEPTPYKDENVSPLS